MIAEKVRFAVKRYAPTDLSTMIEESLDGTQRTSLHNVQSGIQSVVYNVFEHVMVGLLSKYLIGETLNNPIAMFFDTNAAGEWWPRGC